MAYSDDQEKQRRKQQQQNRKPDRSAATAREKPADTRAGAPTVATATPNTNLRQAVTPQPAPAQANPLNQDRFYLANNPSERLTARPEQATTQADDRLAHYNRFLTRQNINPFTIGGATLVPEGLRERGEAAGMRVPTMGELAQADRFRAQKNALHSRMVEAANYAMRGNPALGLNLYQGALAGAVPRTYEEAQERALAATQPQRFGLAWQRTANLYPGGVPAGVAGRFGPPQPNEALAQMQEQARVQQERRAQEEEEERKRNLARAGVENAYRG